MEKAQSARRTGTEPSALATKKAWEAPRIVQHDLLETVAAVCQASFPDVAKSTLACNVQQT